MENPPIEIINLPEDGWRAYRQLRLESLADSPQAFGAVYQMQLKKPDEYWQSRLEDAAKGEESWLLFARSEDRLVGMMGAFRVPSNDSQAAVRVADIISVYVTPSARGRGISSLLMEAILSVLQKSGIQIARLGVNTGQTAAVHLYQSFGFTVTDTVHQLMGDGAYHDEFIMEKIISRE